MPSFYQSHGSIILRLWDDAKVIDIYHQETLLNIKITIYDFFVVACLCVRPKSSGCEHVARFRQGKSKQIRRDAHSVITITAPTSITSWLSIWVAVKTITKS